MSLNISKLAKSIVEVVHGIPEARARKERAEASMKEIEMYERYLEFFKKAGFSEEELKAIILYNKEIIKYHKKINCFANKSRAQFSLPPPRLKGKQKKEGK